MTNYYCVYDKEKEPIAIFQDIHLSIKFRCHPDYLETRIQRIDGLPKLDGWYNVVQDCKFVGYFKKREDISEFLIGPFESKKI